MGNKRLENLTYNITNTYYDTELTEGEKLEIIYDEAQKQQEKETESNLQKSLFLRRKDKKDKLQEHLINEYGNFHLLFFNNLLSSGINKQYEFRFLLLNSLLEYNDNKLIWGKSKNKKGVIFMEKYAREKDLQEIWNLSKDETRRTKETLLKANLISIDENGYIKVNPKVAIRGNVNDKNIDKFTRVFNQTIQNLYYNSTPKEHKFLFNIVELLPYINFNFNIICDEKSTNEKNIENIKPLNWKEISNKLGYKNLSRFKKDLLNITVGNKSAIMFIEKKNTKFITVNPSIFYRGNNINDLNTIAEYFKLKTNE